MEDEGQAGVLQLVHEYFGFHWFDINTVNILLRADRSVLDLLHFKSRTTTSIDAFCKFND